MIRVYIKCYRMHFKVHICIKSHNHQLKLNLFVAFNLLLICFSMITEMLSRGELRSLLVGVLIATPSGAGVALSVLGGNAGSLVGVAISASLLPPAINCGMFWSLSIVILIAGYTILHVLYTLFTLYSLRCNSFSRLY